MTRSPGPLPPVTCQDGGEARSGGSLSPGDAGQDHCIHGSGRQLGGEVAECQEVESRVKPMPQINLNTGEVPKDPTMAGTGTARRPEQAGEDVEALSWSEVSSPVPAP